MCVCDWQLLAVTVVLTLLIIGTARAVDAGAPVTSPRSAIQQLTGVPRVRHRPT